MRRAGPLAALLAVLAAVLALAGCGGSTARDGLLVGSAPATVTLRLATVAPYGQVLVDGDGRALYMFPPDARTRVTCTGPCAGTWPPLAVRSASGVRVAAGARAALVGTVADPNSGRRVVTYAGYPLYRYAGDVAAGTADGQALFADGGPWYLLAGAGTPVTTDPAGGS